MQKDPLADWSRRRHSTSNPLGINKIALYGRQILEVSIDIIASLCYIILAPPTMYTPRLLNSCMSRVFLLWDTSTWGTSLLGWGAKVGRTCVCLEDMKTHCWASNQVTESLPTRSSSSIDLMMFGKCTCWSELHSRASYYHYQ